MKRLVLFAVAFTQIIGASAQINVNSDQKVLAPSQNSINDTYDGTQKKAPIGTYTNKNDKGLGERVLGTTTYDLQTNATVQDRIARNSTGEMSIVWTASEANNPFSDRGAGYSHYNPTTDTWTQSASYPRIESDRCGWPTILYDGNGGEILISHSTVSNTMRINTRSTIGSGTWSEKAISSTHLTWNRAAMGGTDGNTIHMVALMNNPADSAQYQNMSRCLLYYRSQDAGQTWDIQDLILPGLDSSEMGVGATFSGDAYSVIADGNHVAIGIFNSWNDVILMESMNNGTNWTKTIVYDFPFKGYQDFKNKASDTIFYEACDGSGSITLDNNGDVHLAYDRVAVTNNFAGGTSYRPWDPDMDTTYHYRNSSPSFLGTSSHYINDDSLLNFTKFGFYGSQGVTSFGNMAFGNDSLYYVWSGVSDSISSGIDPAVNMRQIYLIKSGDYGVTWTEPLQLTISDPQFADNVFPDIYSMVDDKIRLTFQRDPYPSVFVTSLNYTPSANQYTQTSLSDNDIIYLEIDLGGGGIGIGIEENISDISDMGVYPNPSHGQVDLTVNIYREMNVTVNVTNINGQIVHTYAGKPLTKGGNKLQMDLSHLEAGIYTVNIFGGGSMMNKKVVIK